jgi:hypothetical protein
MSSHGGSLVHVWTDVGARKPAALLAKIIEKDGVILTIRYLSESDDHIWRYETDTYEIDDDSVAEYLKTDSELELGFVAHVDGGFIKVDSDEDYVPSDEGESESYEDSDDEENEEDEEDFEEDEESDAESEESNVDEE